MKAMRLLTTIGAVAAAAALAATPMIASASDGDNDVAVFAGETPPGTTQVLLVGGGGSYQFNTSNFEGTGTGACVGASTDLDAAVTCTIASQGNFTNTVCGTGNVTSGSATLGEPDGTDTYGIVITFVAGVGVVTSTSGGTLAGVVVLLPSQDELGTPPVCVNGFSVVGVGVAS